VAIYSWGVKLMEEYLGIIKRFAGSFAPRGFLDCDGSLLPISQWSVLFAVVPSRMWWEIGVA
jgi:microcystin-dependent protein